jgi:hypothetical protein
MDRSSLVKKYAIALIPLLLCGGIALYFEYGVGFRAEALMWGVVTGSTTMLVIGSLLISDGSDLVGRWLRRRIINRDGRNG